MKPSVLAGPIARAFFGQKALAGGENRRHMYSSMRINP
jgi:hypothetical protein